MATASDGQPVGTPRRRAPRAAVVGVVIGLASLLVGAYWTGFGSAQLSTALLTEAGRVDATRAPSAAWAAMTILTACGLVLLTGPRAWIRSVDAVAVVGAVWTLGWTALFAALVSSLEFVDPERHCVYRGCWPGAYQAAAVAAPLVVGCLLMVLMATVYRSRSWALRGLVPAATYMVLTLVQVAVWNRLAIPAFSAPPPF